MVLCNLFSCVVVVVVFFISVQDRITRRSLITATKKHAYEQVFSFGLLTDKKLVPSQRKLYTKQTIYPLKGDRCVTNIYKTSNSGNCYQIG